MLNITVRQGAIAVYLETWHLDIYDFIDLKKNGGEEKRRAKELFIAASCSDEFMERVINNEDWTLFDPADTPDLSETYGDEFAEAYKAYERQFELNPEIFTNKPRVVNAKDLWKKMQKMYWETGLPFMFFKDTVNKNHSNPDLGIIRSSNLCTEYLNPVKDKTEVAVCNLGSINLSKFDYTSEVSLQRLEEVVHIGMRMLDNVIDLSSYPTESARDTQLSRRSVGLGVAGEAEAIANAKIFQGTPKHKEYIDIVYGLIASASDKASLDLAAERGAPHSSSPYRNLYRRCIAPTSSISIIMGTTPSHQAVYAPVWIEENKMGNFKVTAPGIKPDNVQYYKSVYDYDQKDLVASVAWKQAHIDMGISFDIHLDPESVTGREVYDILILAWKLGLKTTYYMRTDSPNINIPKETGVGCFGCSG